MTNRILYYPTIEFKTSDYPWLWSASLIWDKIYRIVPDGYELDEPENINRLCASGDIGVPINPVSYSEAVAEEFMDKIECRAWNAAALEFHNDELNDYKEYCRVHKDKVDVALRNVMLLDKDIHEDEEWLYVPQEMSNLYMAYLANRIARENKMSLVTPNADFWTASTYFQHEEDIQDFYFEDDSPQALISLLVKDYIPQNFIHLTPEEILKFREVRKDERTQFITAINRASDELASIADKTIAQEIIHEQQKQIGTAMNEYKKSMDIIGAVEWTGNLSLITAFSADIMQYIGYSLNVISPINTVGIGLGLISGLASQQMKKKAETKNPYSYLLSLNKLGSSSFQDYNYMLNRKIEEFIND